MEGEGEMWMEWAGKHGFFQTSPMWLGNGEYTIMWTTKPCGQTDWPYRFYLSLVDESGNDVATVPFDPDEIGWGFHVATVKLNITGQYYLKIGSEYTEWTVKMKQIAVGS
jgi:hypothetical protein